MMKRVLCIYLPHWPLQRLGHAQPHLRDQPLAIVGQRGRHQVVLWHCPRAQKAGIRPGMTRAEAHASAPDLPLQEEDPEADDRALMQLAQWAERYSPIVGLEETVAPSSLLIDVTGGAACFGGEDALLTKVRKEFTAQGWHVRLALADTVGAAWALAYFAESAASAVRGSDETARALGPLPIAALRLPAAARMHLAELGIERIEQLLTLPRDSLSSRFGDEVLLRIDQALGQQPEPIIRHRAWPDVLARLAFAWPTDRQSDLHSALAHLLQRIEAQLTQRCRGARRIECRLYTEANPPLILELDLYRPSRCAQRLGKLLRTKLEQVQLRSPLSGLAVWVPIDEPPTDHQAELFEEDHWRHDRELGHLIDNLTNRLGRDAVAFARLVPDHQPELACRLEPATACSLSPPWERVGVRGSTKHQIPNPKQSSKTKSQTKRPHLFGSENMEFGIRLEFDAWRLEFPYSVRPLDLWPRPKPIEVLAVVPPGRPHVVRAAGQEYRIVRAWGPERIETGWWRGPEARRDYFIIETHLGTRLWIFRRQEDERWFWHGCFE
jgi:protein ImuB